MKSLLVFISADPPPLAEPSAFPEEINVVAMLGSDHDRGVLTSIAEAHGWSLHLSDTCEEAWSLLCMRQAPLIVFDRAVPGPEWKDVIRLMASASHRPCVILLAPVVDYDLIREVMKLGGHDVVSKPLSASSLGLSLRLALRYWASGLRRGAAPASLVANGSV